MIRAVLVLGGAAGRAMRARGHGPIINVASTAGFVTLGSYSAIKAWVTAYSGVAGQRAGRHRRPGHRAAARAGCGPSSTSAADVPHRQDPRPLWLDADRLVARGLADAERGRVISIPSVRYKVLILFARHVPASRRARGLGADSPPAAASRLLQPSQAESHRIGRAIQGRTCRDQPLHLVGAGAGRGSWPSAAAQAADLVAGHGHRVGREHLEDSTHRSSSSPTTPATSTPR